MQPLPSRWRGNSTLYGRTVLWSWHAEWNGGDMDNLVVLRSITKAPISQNWGGQNHLKKKKNNQVLAFSTFLHRPLRSTHFIPSHWELKQLQSTFPVLQVQQKFSSLYSQYPFIIWINAEVSSAKLAQLYSAIKDAFNSTRVSERTFSQIATLSKKKLNKSHSKHHKCLK